MTNEGRAKIMVARETHAKREHGAGVVIIHYDALLLGNVLFPKLPST